MLTSQSQRIVLMPPQQFVQSKNKEACAAVPLRNQEHGADAFEPGNNEDVWYVVPASIVVTADHGPGRDDGGPSGRRFCWLGSKVVNNHPKPTRRTLMPHNTKNTGRSTSDVSQLVGQTSDSARCAIYSTGVLWWHGVQPQ